MTLSKTKNMHSIEEELSKTKIVNYYQVFCNNLHNNNDMEKNHLNYKE